MDRQGHAPGDDYRTLDGVALAILVLFTADALRAELAWLWHTLRLFLEFP